MTYAENLWLFTLLLAGIIVVPGMDMIFVIANGLTGGRRAGMADLDRAITAAVRFGGGKREQGAETLDTLIASGAMSVTDAMQLLPQLQRKATGTGADPAELAQIAIRGMQTFGIKPDQISQALDMAIVAGQAGGFELKDMARWLPKQMAAGRMSGLSGIEGFLQHDTGAVGQRGE